MADVALKTELTLRLTQSRRVISRQLGDLKEDLDISSHIKQSFLKNKIPWLGAVTFLGWGLFSRLGKQRTVHSEKKSDPKPFLQKKPALFPIVASLLFQAARPALAAFVTRKIADLGSNPKR